MNTRLGWFLLIAVSSFLVASCHAEEVQVENVKVDVESPVDKPAVEAVDEVVPAEKTVLTDEKEEVAVPDPVAAEDAPKESARSARNYRYYDEDEYDDDDDEFEDVYPAQRHRYYDEYEEDDEDEDEFEPPYRGRYDEDDDDDDDVQFEDEDEYDYNELGRSVDVAQGKQAAENGANAVNANGSGSRIVCTYGNVVVTQATNRKGVVCTPPGGGRQQPNQRPVRPNKVRPQNQNNNQNRRRNQQQRRRRQQQQQRRRNQNRRQQNNNQFGGRRGNNRRRFNRPSGKTTGEQKNVAPQIIPASNVKVIRL